MKQINLTLKRDVGSICYEIDAEGRTYTLLELDADGKQLSEPEVKQINDPQLLAKRVYQIVHAALSEQRT